MKALVYGLGRSGLAACELLSSQGHEVLCFDQRTQEVNISNCQVTINPTEENVDICIAAPGVPYDHPDLQTLRARGIQTIGEVEWVFRSVKAEIIGITATAGKTTVTNWLSSVLSQAGLDAPAGGNIEPALAKIARPGATLITELSSFQLERCPTLKPSIAIILNLGIDHIDRHGSIEAYHRAKHNLIANLDQNSTFIYNRDDSILSKWASASSARVLSYSLEQSADAYLKGNEFMLMDRDRPLLSTTDLQIEGRHFYSNLLAVVLASKAKGLTHEQICTGLINLETVEGRYSLVGKVKNISFIEDSIATRTLAVKAALVATPKPIVWLLGGEDKGASFTDLEQLVREKVVMAIGIGKSGEHFTKELSSWVETKYCTEVDGEAALFKACKLAIECLLNYPQGGTVLLAPLAASFDQFEDYKERARAFRKVVNELTQTLEPILFLPNTKNSNEQ